MTSTLTEVETSPVFVDRTGRRGRRLRGLGWVVGAGFVGVTLAMVSGLLGTQSDAPSFAVPDTANTLPPGRYVNAPLPSPPGKADPRKGAPHTAVTTPAGAADPTATATGTTDPTAGPGDSTKATGTPPAHSTTGPPEHSPPSTPAKSTAGSTTAPPAHSTPTASAPPPPPTPSSTTAPPAAPDPAP